MKIMQSAKAVRVVTMIAVYKSRSKSQEKQTKFYKNTKTYRKKRNKKKSKIEHTKSK